MFSILVFLVAFVSAYWLLRPEEEVDPLLAIEPNAPISKEFTATNYNPLARSSVTEIAGLIPAVDEQSQLLLTDSLRANKLVLINAADSSTLDIETEGVSKAKYATSQLIYYQKHTAEAGIYTYNLATRAKSLLIATQDPETFDNIALLDQSSYFFIQANTGKVGFVKVDGTQVILAEKKLATRSNYVQAGAYKYAVVSPDKQWVAFFDLSQDESGQTMLYIVPTSASKLSEAILSIETKLSSRSLLPGEELLRWSNDSKYLFSSAQAQVIGIAERQVVSELKEGDGVIIPSPVDSKVVVIDLNTTKAQVRNYQGELLIELPDHVSQAAWFSGDVLILNIGQSLYTYKLSTKTLNKLNLPRATYELIQTNLTAGQLLVKNSQGKLILIKIQIS